MKANPTECAILRRLYLGPIQWRGPESVTSALAQLRKAHVQVEEINVAKVLAFANATEAPPPSKRKQTPESLMEEAMNKMADALKKGSFLKKQRP